MRKKTASDRFMGTPGWNDTRARTGEGASLLPKVLRSFRIAMRTPRPAARPTLAVDQVLPRPLDMLPAGLRLLDVGDPADPLVPSERSDVLPGGLGRGGRVQGFAQVRGHLVERAGRGLRFHGAPRVNAT